jgi:hypothetical protein
MPSEFTELNPRIMPDSTCRFGIFIYIKVDLSKSGITHGIYGEFETPPMRLTNFKESALHHDVRYTFKVSLTLAAQFGSLSDLT